MSTGARAAAVCLLLPVWSQAAAQVPVNVWESRARSTPSGHPGSSAEAIRPLADGSFIVAGPDGMDGAVSAVRYSASGALLSVATVARGERGRLAVDDFGALVSAADVGGAAGDVSVMKRDGITGADLWSRPVMLDGPQHGNDLAGALAIDPIGDVLVAARVGVTMSAASAAVWKIDGRTGAILWGPTVVDGVTPSVEPVVLRCDSRGNAYLGVTRGTPGGTVRLNSVTRLDGVAGTVAWSAGFGHTYYDALVDLVVDRQGDVVATGLYGGTATLVKLAGWSGQMLWGPVAESGFRDPRALAVDPHGDVTLVATKSPSGGALALFHHDSRTGARLWGPVSWPGMSSTALLAADGAGDLFVAATSGNASFSTDIVVASFAGSTGTTRWGPVVWDGPWHFNDEARALALDSAGALLVAGNSPLTGSVALRYDGATGSLLLPALVFTGRARGRDEATDGVRDLSGDLLVAARTGDGDAAVTRFDRLSGRVVWGPVPVGIPSDSVLTPHLASAPSGGAVLSRWGPGGTTVARIEAARGTASWTRTLGISSPVVTCDAAGDVLTAGLSSGNQLVVEKLSGATGATLRGPDTLAVPLLAPMAAGVDANGDLVVAGTGNTSGSLYAVKVAGASGALAWGPSVVPLAGSWTSLEWVMRFDGSGDVVVSTTESLTKLGGGDGALRWGPIPPGASDIVLDPSGDVLVTGPSTFRREAATGSLVWEAGVAGRFLRRTASGDLLVLGSSYDGTLGNAFLLSHVSAKGDIVWGPIRLAGGSEAAALEIFEDDALLAGTTTELEKEIVALRVTDGLTLSDESQPPDLGWCNRPYSFLLAAANATTPVAFTLDSGTLPPGLVLGADGLLSGTPTAAGEFPVILGLADASGRRVSREVLLRVLPLTGSIHLDARPSPACLGPAQLITASGVFESYRWLPGGETTSTITVQPAARTTYGLEAVSGGCVSRGSITVGPYLPPAASSVAAPPSWEYGSPLAASAAPHAGSVYAWTASGGSVDSGQGTSAVTIIPDAPGLLRLALRETDADGCEGPEAERAIQIVSFSAGTLFHTVAPCRLLDTREAPDSPLSISGTGRLFAPLGACDVSFGARSLVLNVTVTEATANGALRFAPGRFPPVPPNDLVPFSPGRTRAVNAIMPMPDDGSDLLTLYAVGSSGTVHVIVDVSGYFE